MSVFIAALLSAFSGLLPPQSEAAFAAYEIPLGAPVWALEITPLDAGDTPDGLLLMGEQPDEKVLVSLNGRGDGRLEVASATQLDAQGATAFALGDLNQDGWLDVAVMGDFASSTGICLGNGDLIYGCGAKLPTAGPSEFDVALTDLDGDGDLDTVILAEDFGWYLDVGENDGSGRLGIPNFVFGYAPTTIWWMNELVFADVDNTGRDSVLVAGLKGVAMSTWEQALSPSNPGVQLASGKLWDLQAVDLNRDDFLDLVVAAPEAGAVYVLLNDQAGGFPNVISVPTGGAVESLAAGDVTGDGVVDLVAANRDHSNLVVLRGDGAGGYTLVDRYGVTGDPTDVELADLEGDGDLDIVVAGRASGALTVLLNQIVR